MRSVTLHRFQGALSSRSMSFASRRSSRQPELLEHSSRDFGDRGSAARPPVRGASPSFADRTSLHCRFCQCCMNPVTCERSPPRPAVARPGPKCHTQAPAVVSQTSRSQMLSAGMVRWMPFSLPFRMRGPRLCLGSVSSRRLSLLPAMLRAASAAAVSRSFGSAPPTGGAVFTQCPIFAPLRNQSRGGDPLTSHNIAVPREADDHGRYHRQNQSKSCLGTSARVHSRSSRLQRLLV